MRSTSVTSTDPSWYVIRTHPKQEDRANYNLNSGGLETFSPKIKRFTYNQFNGARTQVVKHLFPRYIFARFSLDRSLHQVRFTRGVHSVISFGDQPTPVNEEIICLIQSRVGRDGFVSALDELCPGDEVTIRNGALKGLAGTFERQMKDPERVRIMLKTVSFQAHIVVEKEWVARRA